MQISVNSMRLFACTLMSVFFAGCMSTSLRSMATHPTPISHSPRMDPQSRKSEMDFSVDGFGIFNNAWFNTKEINAGGGDLGFSYRLGEFLSPLFVGAHIGAFAGSVQFNCDKKSHCADSYQAWLQTDKGKDKYSFWSLSEQVVAGAEFNLPANLFVGFDGGVKLFQGGGEYDDKRQELEDRIPSVKNSDDGYGIAPLVDFWLGYYVGDNGKYGALSLQGAWSTSYRDEHEMRIPVSLSYFHSSGIHGGVTWIRNTDFGFSIGKTFSL